MEEELHLRFIFWEGSSQIKSEENARATITRKVPIWGQASLPRGRNGDFFRWKELEREQQCHERLEQSAGTNQKCFILHLLTEPDGNHRYNIQVFFYSCLYTLDIGDIY